jgi:hypothetical protein
VLLRKMILLKISLLLQRPNEDKDIEILHYYPAMIHPVAVGAGHYTNCINTSLSNPYFNIAKVLRASEK